MGWGFRRRVRLLPGVTLNFSKSGISTTIGPKGASINLGKKGAYRNLGLPGTGIYSRQRIAAAVPTPQEDSRRRSGFPAWLILLAGIGALVLFASGGKDDSASNMRVASLSSPAIAAAPSRQAPEATKTRYVTATRLNCRAAPDPSARTIRQLTRGARVDVIDNANEWAEISHVGGNCWSSDRYLSALPPEPEAPKHALGVASSTRGTALPRPRRRYQEASCPCSGANVCIGPRGGRYCITSGGNKRYGV